MTITLHAQPYDITATGFFFDTLEDYRTNAAALRNEHGDPVEEFEIQFIDGDEIDAALARAWGLNQANVGAFLDKAGEWNEEEKFRFIIAVEECGYDEGRVADTPYNIDLDVYHAASLRELAEHFIEERLFGDIPERLQFYLDYDAIARDLGMDYAETSIAGRDLVYRCG